MLVVLSLCGMMNRAPVCLHLKRGGRDEMKALSVKQPWASLIAGGHKTIEWRSWRTHYRGPLLICSGKTPDDIYFEFDPDEARQNWPLGVAVATVELVEVRPFDAKKDAEAAMLDEDDLPSVQGFSWVLENPVPVPGTPPVRGKQGLFEVTLQPAL